MLTEMNARNSLMQRFFQYHVNKSLIKFVVPDASKMMQLMTLIEIHRIPIMLNCIMKYLVD